jgi:hypothetical protein
MLIDDRDKKAPPPDEDDNDAGLGAAGPSNPQSASPPPAFTSTPPPNSNVHADFADSNYFVPPGGEGPPPEFAPYVAEYFEAGDGSIVSHDRHLNEDGKSVPVFFSLYT